MSKYGNKFTCWQCSTKYYDLGKSNPKCPKCGAEPSADPLLGGGGALEEEEIGAEIEEEFEAPTVDEDEDVEDVEEETVDEDY